MAKNKDDEPTQNNGAVKETSLKERTNPNDDGDSDDSDLMAAAAAWAAQNDDEQQSRTTGQSGDEQQHQQNQLFSLHVTQIDYQATDWDIRHHFSTAGCAVMAVRLVYDNNNHGSQQKPQRTFRGVAFVDVADEASFRTALQKLHKSVLCGRRINVRPFKTKQELADIVQRTKERVAATIQTERAKKKRNREENHQHQSGEPDTTNTQEKKKRHQRQGNNDDGGGKSSNQKRSPSNHHNKSNNRPRGDDNNKSSSPRKLTKQQRNRRAAILLSKKKRGRK